MVQIGPLRMTETWKYALIGGLLALPFTALAAWQSSENISLGMVVVGSAIAGYLVKRRSGNSTATGLRAAFIGGFPAIWPLSELIFAIPTFPNPLWFQVVAVAMMLMAGGFVLAAVAVYGALAGRFGGWLAERRGHGGVADAGGGV